ncbi:MAG: hypothetical protein ACOX1P_04780 [Thermoguttaceae bacterium]
MRQPLFLCLGCLVLAISCGETNHPVRRQTLDVPPSESVEGDSREGGRAEDSPPAGLPDMPQMPPKAAPPAAALNIKAPEGWIQRQPRVSLITAEFALPKAEGDQADGRLTVSTAGGSVEANLERWRGQFDDLKDKPSETLEVAGRKVTLVDLSGTFNDQPGPFTPGEKRANYRMLGAIIPMEGENLFVKAYGPEKTIARHEAAFKEFVKSLVPGE